MCYIIINFGFTCYIVNPTATTYQQGVFAVIKFLHSGNASRSVKVWKTADVNSRCIMFVECSRSHCSFFYFPFFEAFRLRLKGLFLCAISNGGRKNDEQGTDDEIY